MKRRTFIGTSVAAAAVYAARPSWAAASEHEIKRVGLQLYTVRAEMPKDFEGTIAKVGATGYKEVEFAGYFNHSAKDVRAIVDKNGLTAPSTHLGYDLIENKMPEMIEVAHTIGHKYIVCPWLDEKQRNADGWKRAADVFSKAGQACANDEDAVEVGSIGHRCTPKLPSEKNCGLSCAPPRERTSVPAHRPTAPT